ncbi:MAG: FAD binding domain-containing protein [Bacteroidetes bacterium]|nr:FAD binding domain-containing protein [Bacteroidota bacterium]
MIVAEKLYLKPKTIDEAIRLAKKHAESFHYLAGGTDVIVNKFQGNEESDCLIDITDIEELKQIIKRKDHISIGSLVRLDDLKNHTEIKKLFPALLEAAHSVASPMLRKTATIGGNILCENRCVFYNQSEWWREAVGYCLKCDGEVCIATGGKKNCFSKFVSDTAPVLIALNASLDIVDSNGDQTLALEDIYSGDGMKPRKLSHAAIIRSINIPTKEKQSCVFKKLRPREAVDFSSLTTAVSKSESGKIRVVLGGVDPKPILVEGTIKDNKEELIKQAVKKARIIDNDFYPRLYRKEMITVFLERSFEEIFK